MYCMPQNSFRERDQFYIISSGYLLSPIYTERENVAILVSWSYDHIIPASSDYS